MSYGITAIISKQSGVAEIIHHAFKIDYWDVDLWAETINHLIENPEECRKIGIEGMKEVQRIQWDEAAEKIRQLYATTLSEFSEQRVE